MHATVEVGDIHIIECATREASSISWLKDGERLRPDGRVNIVNQGFLLMQVYNIVYIYNVIVNIYNVVHITVKKNRIILQYIRLIHSKNSFLQDVEPSDDGVYTCVAVLNSGCIGREEARITVLTSQSNTHGRPIHKINKQTKNML